MNVLLPRPCEQWLQKPANNKRAKRLQTEPGGAAVLLRGDHPLIKLRRLDANEQYQGTYCPNPSGTVRVCPYSLNVRIRSLNHTYIIR